MFKGILFTLSLIISAQSFAADNLQIAGNYTFNDSAMNLLSIKSDRSVTLIRKTGDTILSRWAGVATIDKKGLFSVVLQSTGGESFKLNINFGQTNVIGSKFGLTELNVPTFFGDDSLNEHIIYMRKY